MNLSLTPEEEQHIYERRMEAARHDAFNRGVSAAAVHLFKAWAKSKCDRQVYDLSLEILNLRKEPIR